MLAAGGKPTRADPGIRSAALLRENAARPGQTGHRVARMDWYPRLGPCRCNLGDARRVASSGGWCRLDWALGADSAGTRQAGSVWEARPLADPPRSRASSWRHAWWATVGLGLSTPLPTHGAGEDRSGERALLVRVHPPLLGDGALGPSQLGCRPCAPLLSHPVASGLSPDRRGWDEPAPGDL